MKTLQFVASVLRTSRELISRVSQFLRKVADLHGPVRIYGFTLGKNGYGRIGTEYYPGPGEIDLNMPGADQRYYELDPNKLDIFDFHLFLGALLADHKTFIIRKPGMEKNEVLFTFSLLDIGLSPSDIICGLKTPPGFPSLGELYVSNEVDYHLLSEFWFAIQTFMWENNDASGFLRPRRAQDWKEFCQGAGIPELI